MPANTIKARNAHARTQWETVENTAAKRVELVEAGYHSVEQRFNDPMSGWRGFEVFHNSASGAYAILSAIWHSGGLDGSWQLARVFVEGE